MSATCTAAIPGLDGRCTGCSRPTAVYDGRTLHKRGRWREGGQAAATMRLARQANLARRAEERERGRAVAARLRAADFDGDVCECGVPLDQHPPLPKLGALSTKWVSRFDMSKFDVLEATGQTKDGRGYRRGRPGSVTTPDPAHPWGFPK